MDINYNQLSLVGNEFLYMKDAIENEDIAGLGKYTTQCEKHLEKELGIQKAYITTSCTHSLEMSAIALKIFPGDEVIVPTYTFVSTVNAFVLRGAKPIFVDVRPDTLNIDESQIEAKITPKTKAIIVVHYAGVGCEMDMILKIANRHGIPVIEDNAHVLFGKYKGRYLGTFGCMATQSFHGTKNIVCGQGGALLLNDPQYREIVEIIREKGTDRNRFFRGEVDKYTWVDLGSSYFPSEILTAFLYAQLEKAHEIQKQRKSNWEYYHSNLEEWAEKYRVQLPHIPEYCEHTAHIFYMLTPDREMNLALKEYLKNKGIQTAGHYSPLHLSKMGGGKIGDCPIAESISDRIIRLPLHQKLSQQDLDKIVNTIKEFESISNLID